MTPAGPFVEACGDHVHSVRPGRPPRCHRATGVCARVLLYPEPATGAPGPAVDLVSAVRDTVAAMRQAYIDRGPAACQERTAP